MKLYSASQVSNFRACQRLWAWDKLAGVESVSHPAAALGKDAHSQLEQYLTNKVEFDYTTKAGLVASALLGLLPDHGEGQCEKHWTLPSSIGDWGYQGYIDWYAPGRVIDFKTTSDLKWAKTADDLRVDPQAVLYAVFAFTDTDTPTVDLEWLYSQTRGASKVKRVHLRVVANDVVDAFLDIEATVATMHAIVAATPDSHTDDYVRSLPPSPSRCQSYGGCPHRTRCALSPDLIIDSYGIEQTMPTPAELIATLNARKNAAAVVQAVLPTVSHATAAASVALGAPPDVAPAAPPLDIQTSLFVAPAINPPESLLPEAPAVRKAGRPAGSKNKAAPAVEAPVAAVEAPESERCPTIPAPPRLPSPMVEYRDERVTVTWAEETFTPVPYHTFKIGPFTLEGFVRSGESLTDAMHRLYRELEAFAIKERRMKAESFRATLGGV